MTARAAFLRRLLAALLMAVLLPLAGTLQAHEMSMAELNLRELSKGEFIWSWGQSGKGSRPIAADLTPVWPEGCKPEKQSLRCTDAHGLSGRLAVNGVGKAYSAAMVRIVWLDGQERVYTITAAQPSVMLYGAANDERGADEIVRAYTMLGIEHILSGFDHLLFVFSLLFLVGFNRRLAYTITAFTAAHSITLACSALGLLTLRSAPVEASIALSIMLVAVEALNHRDDRDKGASLSQRWPAFVSFLFGLVHGLGFAGALKEIGLPEQHMTIALLTFNVGVELGQLLMVGLAFGLVKLLGRQSWFVRLRRPALYGIGIIASYWSLTRLVAILT